MRVESKWARFGSLLFSNSSREYERVFADRGVGTHSSAITHSLLYEMSSQIREFCSSAGKLYAVQQHIESANLGLESLMKSMSLSRELLTFDTPQPATVLL